MLYTRKGDGGTTSLFSAKGGPASGWGCDLPAPRHGKFFVYVILCDDQSIYIGQTDNLGRRWKEHCAGFGADYFKQHKPLKIAHYEEFFTRSDAVKREKELKTGFGRKWLKKEIKNGRARQAGQRISKSSAIAECLGTLDEINSYLGVCKDKSRELGFKVDTLNLSFQEIVHTIQKNLFIIQAEFAGADKTISKDKVEEVEKIIDEIEKELPPIKTFFIGGASELGAHFDFARRLSQGAPKEGLWVCERLIRLRRTPKMLIRLRRTPKMLIRLRRTPKGKNL